MTDATGTHFFQHFFSDPRGRAERPLLCEKQGSVFHSVTQREGAARINDFARALFAGKIEAGDRVALHAPASPSLLIAEWAVLASRAVAVIIPRTFSQEDIIETLIESKSRVIVLDRLAAAYHLAASASLLPDLNYIICLENGAQGEIPIWSWNDFIDSGRREPDRSSALLRTITEKDTALLFYYKDATQKLQATRYSHSLLLSHASKMGSMLKQDDIRKGELVLTATAWEHPIGHICSCYLPVLKDAVIQITHGIADMVLFENSPEVIVGDSMFFDGVRQSIEKHLRQTSLLECWLLKKALMLGKQSFEAKNAGFFARLKRAFLKATIISKVQKMLGGKARLFIGTDNEAHYDLELFFHTFGIELVELPEEVFK